MRFKNSSGTVKATITPDQSPGLAGNADDIAAQISRWLMCCAVVAQDHIVLPPAIRIFRPAQTGQGDFREETCTASPLQTLKALAEAGDRDLGALLSQVSLLIGNDH